MLDVEEMKLEMNHVPKFTQFAKRIEDPSNYMMFIDRFVRRVVKAGRFDPVCTNELLSEYVTVSDEAFALLLYENQEQRWEALFTEMYQNNNKKPPQMPGKYTDGGTRKGRVGRSTTKNGGWHDDGLERFNDICVAISEERKTDAREDFEREYLKNKRDANQAKRNQKSRKKIYDGSDRGPVKVFTEMDFEVLQDLEHTDSYIDEEIEEALNDPNRHEQI